MKLFVKTPNHMNQFCIYPHKKVQSCGCGAFSSRELLIIIVFIITLFSMVLIHTYIHMFGIINSLRLKYNYVLVTMLLGLAMFDSVCPCQNITLALVSTIYVIMYFLGST